jgi:aminoglycoside N3'-acetyltransferase
MRTSDQIVADLRPLGIRRGQALMVHASLRAIGPVEGGAGGMIRALDAAVGRTGGVMMVLGARDDWAWVNDRPESERAALLAEAEPFDAARTPADPDVGRLAEVFRTTPGTLVTDHPEGRFGARGSLARTLLEDQPWDDYYGPGSPLERLCRLNGAVLRLGADPNTVTLLHYAEYLAAVPAKRRLLRHRRVLGPDGPAIRTVGSLDDSDGIVAWPGEDYFTLILQDYLAAGHGARDRVGQAASELLDARDLVAYAAVWMERRFAQVS